MIPSGDCIALVKEFEGCVLTAYRDQVGVLTIAYGHTGSDVTKGLTITQEQADALLQADLAIAASAVNRLVRVALTQHQFDALVDFVFNLGAESLAWSTLLLLLNRGNYAGAAFEFARWNHAGGAVVPGLTRRREAERDLYLRG